MQTKKAMRASSS